MALPRTSTVAATERKFQGYGAVIGTLLVRVARSPEFPLPEETAPSPPALPMEQFADQPVELAANDEDLVFALQEPHGGEGVFHAHRQARAEEHQHDRFWASRGIDVAKEPAGSSFASAIRLARAIGSAALTTPVLSATPPSSWLPARSYVASVVAADGTPELFFYNTDGSDEIRRVTSTDGFATLTNVQAYAGGIFNKARDKAGR